MRHIETSQQSLPINRLFPGPLHLLSPKHSRLFLLPGFLKMEDLFVKAKPKILQQHPPHLFIVTLLQALTMTFAQRCLASFFPPSFSVCFSLPLPWPFVTVLGLWSSFNPSQARTDPSTTKPPLHRITNVIGCYVGLALYRHFLPPLSLLDSFSLPPLCLFFTILGIRIIKQLHLH